VIVIHHGKILYDGDLSGLVDKFSALKTIVLTVPDSSIDLSMFGEVTSREPSRVTLRVPRGDTSRVTAQVLASLPVSDLTVEDPPIEEVIEHVFAQGLEHAA
jgi:ABC-2 type transport system ATP-binding protein